MGLNRKSGDDVKADFHRTLIFVNSGHDDVRVTEHAHEDVSAPPPRHAGDDERGSGCTQATAYDRKESFVEYLVRPGDDLR